MTALTDRLDELAPLNETGLLRCGWHRKRLLAALRLAIAQRDNAMDTACLMSGSVRDTSILDAAILAKLRGEA